MRRKFQYWYAGRYSGIFYRVGYRRQKCAVCDEVISTSGLARASHERSAEHIAGLKKAGREDLIPKRRQSYTEPWQRLDQLGAMNQ